MAKNQKGKKPAPKKEAKTEKQEVADIPEFRDEDGVLRVLKQKDFPSSLEGKLAHCDYQIAKIEDKKKRLSERNDPQAKTKRKLERYKKLIADLEDELADSDE